MRQVVLKLQSRCNLSCDYCYVYESVDQSWRTQPVTMSAQTIDRLSQRIAEHAARHRLESLQVVLHGGEPLLAGHDVVEAALVAVRAAVPAHTTVQFSIQTNGILLDERFLQLFHEHGVKVGVSLDGDATATDRHRVYANGRGSYDRITAGLTLLTRDEHRDIYGGLLCTIDLHNDPVRVFEALAEFRPPMIDLLLPHGNWTNPPPQGDGTLTYADWLIRVFDAWFDGPPDRTRIRLFESIIARLLGRPSGTEAIGGDLPGIVTIETDGSYEQSDALKTTTIGGPATGLSTDGHSLDDVLAHLAVAAPVQLSATCQACPVVKVCGGGLRAHRYKAGNGFDNPSVYCADLLALITHIGSRVKAGLPATRTPARGLTTAEFEALAAGYGDAGAMSVLGSGQLAKRKGLLFRVASTGGQRPAAELIARAEQAAPEAVAAVLAHPHLDAWATLCLLRLARPTGGDGDGRPLADELGHINGIAVAAAVAAGLDFDVELPTLDGTACVPGLGSATGLGPGPARATGTAAGTRFVGHDGVVVHRDGPGWQPLRTIQLGPGHTLTIEDQDPYRNCFQWRPLNHLTDAQADRFGKLLAEAWHLIEQDHPEHAVAIRHGLHSVVPLATPDTGTFSASSEHAYGSIGVSIPDTAAELALLLIHEHMHAKLYALLDLVDLHKRTPGGRYHAPWRLDARPVDALFQGVYAHAGVTDFWRQQRHSADADQAGAARAQAQAQFDKWRAQNRIAAEALAGSGELTPAGERFVTILRNTLHGWDDEPVPAEISSRIALFVLAQTIRWRLSNWCPEPTETEQLVTSVQSAGPFGAIPDGVLSQVGTRGTVMPGAAAGPVDAPGVLGVLHRWPGAETDAPATSGHNPDEAGAMLLAGDTEGAARRYLDRLDRDARDDDAWIGLAVSRTLTARRAGRVDRAAKLVADRPDLCRAAVLKLQSADVSADALAATALLAGLASS
jgi:uncharacterized protein